MKRQRCFPWSNSSAVCLTAARHRHRINIEDPALVAVEEDRFSIGRKRAPTDPRRRHELLDRVLLDDASFRWLGR